MGWRSRCTVHSKRTDRRRPDRRPTEPATMQVGTPVPRSGTSPVRRGVPLNGNGAAAPRSAEIRAGVLERVQGYPQLRFMGSKHRLLPWIHDVLVRLPFDTALDAFT